MNFNNSLELTQSQKLIMTMQLKQSLNILNMSNKNGVISLYRFNQIAPQEIKDKYRMKNVQCLWQKWLLY